MQLKQGATLHISDMSSPTQTWCGAQYLLATNQCTFSIIDLIFRDNGIISISIYITINTHDDVIMM